MKTFDCGHCGKPNEITGLVDDIREFHEKFNRTYSGPPRELPSEELAFRLKALKEELTEYTEAKSLEDRFDALIDLTYFALGAAYLHGFPFADGWRRVHAANMQKILSNPDFPSKRGNEFNGIDIVKPPGWQAPRLADLVKQPVVTKTEEEATRHGPDATALPRVLKARQNIITQEEQ